jgi:hypothetical protein
MQVASSHALLVPLRIGVPRAESVASCLVDRTLFIILQARSEQAAACGSLVMMIPHMTTLTILMSPLYLKYLWILSNLPKFANMQCWLFVSSADVSRTGSVETKSPAMG